jgi:hypothetical protein
MYVTRVSGQQDQIWSLLVLEGGIGVAKRMVQKVGHACPFTGGGQGALAYVNGLRRQYTRWPRSNELVRCGRGSIGGNTQFRTARRSAGDGLGCWQK